MRADAATPVAMRNVVKWFGVTDVRKRGRTTIAREILCIQVLWLIHYFPWMMSAVNPEYWTVF